MTFQMIVFYQPVITWVHFNLHLWKKTFHFCRELLRPYPGAEEKMEGMADEELFNRSFSTLPFKERLIV
eukprot:superscaffoldBa00000047_g813